MAEASRPDEEIADELLRILRSDEPETPADLSDRAIRKVQASITSRDLIDLTTVVFVLKFCAPLLDLVAGFFGQESTHEDRSNENE